MEPKKLGKLFSLFVSDERENTKFVHAQRTKGPEEFSYDCFATDGKMLIAIRLRELDFCVYFRHEFLSEPPNQSFSFMPTSALAKKHGSIMVDAEPMPYDAVLRNEETITLTNDPLIRPVLSVARMETIRKAYLLMGIENEPTPYWENESNPVRFFPFEDETCVILLMPMINKEKSPVVVETCFGKTYKKTLNKV